MVQSYASVADMLKQLSNKKVGNHMGQPNANPIKSANSLSDIVGAAGGYANNPNQPQANPIRSYNSAADMLKLLAKPSAQNRKAPAVVPASTQPPPKPVLPNAVPQSVMDLLGDPLPGNAPLGTPTIPAQTGGNNFYGQQSGNINALKTLQKLFL